MSKLLKSCSFAVVGALLLVGVALTPPASAHSGNDDVLDAIEITGVTSVEVGSNLGATTEGFEFGANPFPIEHTIWYRWTAPRSGVAVVDTLGTAFDSELAVYIDHNGLVLVGWGDSFAGEDDGRVQFAAQAGVTYYIQVDGKTFAQGAVNLDFNLPEFADVLYGYPFFGDVDWVAKLGIAGGYSDGTYRPTAPISRGAMSAFLARLLGVEPTGPPVATFSDVPTTHPFYDEIEWMNHFDITHGYSDGTFRPAAPVTRASMSAFLYRLAESPPTPNPSTPTFSDVSATHPFNDEIEWMNEEGITTGYSDGTFRPGDVVRRGPMAAFLQRWDSSFDD